ncbi:PR domain zinc finger protein 8 [Lampris incognitus]|uniref:PR domain zinc finger protein 8 n=1 Tax=Lampris incognitus TaxID=2546036 RepID=UPI0024B4F3DB|nr:PR domain zinc finger protein 8 [Lampris incognitus]
MDPSFLPRSLWTSDGRILHHSAADVFTSVVVTRSIPAGTSFGPCVLHHTFYDTIAFIAQKSRDKRAKSYVFRVDPEAMRNAALVLSWLRLVHAARNREEQNTEAYLKAGQLYVRTTRDIRQEEELLVWYDQELSHLLGLTDVAARARAEGEECPRCDQAFKNEYPLQAHCRFLCGAQVKDGAAWSREAYEQKRMEMKRQHRVTDFHNIARDLEHKKSGTADDAEMSKKRKHEETVYSRGRKSVLLEKNNISNDNNITQPARDHDRAALDADRLKGDHLECRSGALPEAGDAKGRFTHDKRGAAALERPPASGESSGAHPASSAFSLVAPNGQGEQRSAFCKPSRKIPPSDPTAHLPSAPAALCSRLEDVADVFNSRSVVGYSSLMTPGMLTGDLRGPQAVRTAATVSGGAFHYAPEHWSASVGAQLQAPSSLTILPPTFTSFGVSVQNWCAKCNLSFRMTSDLVFHMRSHHKKEFAAESQVRKRREEKLTCPICHEYFRERHHLSRHMTSHN